MSLASIGLSLTLLMSTATQQPQCETAAAPGSPSLGYRVRVVEMEGLKWRSDLHKQLRPIARQGGAAVWLIDETALGGLLETSKETLFSPKAATGREIPADLRTSLRVNYVAHLERVADGPPGKATALAYRPEIGSVDESLSVSIQCKPAATGGAMAKVVMDEMRLAAMERHELVEEVQPGPDAKPGTKPVPVKAQLQVPLMVEGQVEGEWRVPEGQALVVSLGAHEMKTRDGRTKLTERVAVIDPDPAPSAPSVALAPKAPKRPIIVPPPVDYGAARVGMMDLPPLPQTPAPIAHSGRWTQRSPESLALNAGERPLNPADVQPVPIEALLPGSSQPIVIQHASGPGTTIIIVPGNGAVNVLTPSAELLAMRPTTIPISYGTLPPSMPPVPAMAAPAMPAMPSRSLPTPLNSQGEEVPLPPLPMAESYVPDDGSGETRGTPQTTTFPDATEAGDVSVCPEMEGSDAVAEEIVWTTPAAHVAVALGAVFDASNFVEEPCDSPFCCRKSEIVLGVTPANGWRSASEPTPGAIIPRDETVQRTALLPKHGRLSIGISASASPAGLIPNVSATGTLQRVAVPIGPFRLQVELSDTSFADSAEEPAIDGQP